MPAAPTVPVEDTVAKFGNEIAVGEDIEFQRRWWRFEKLVWAGFVLIVLLDLAGAFGRGPLAKAHANSRGGTMAIDYERIERFSTPSILTIHFGPSALTGGKIHLWVSDSIVKSLGNQRVVPEPAASVIGNGGILYTFDATSLPDSVEFALQPSHPGIAHFQLRVPGATLDAPPRDEFQAKVVVMP